MIEESDGDETKNQIGASPEPDVLMKHVEYDDSQNKQDVLHGGEKVSSPFGECQVLDLLRRAESVPLICSKKKKAAKPKSPAAAWSD